MAGTSGEAACTVFVGSISPGVSDRWLVQLFQACGGYRSFKRVSKAFGFADFTTLRDALRVLHVLHDLELPSMGAHHAAPRKRLIVRADEKTSAFLSEFEKTVVRTDADALQDAAARSRVDYVIEAMAAPGAETGEEPERYEIPSHLKDLPVDELPADRRKDVLSEIDQFRLRAVASDAARRRRELELERERAAAQARSQSPARATARASPRPPAAEAPRAAADEDPEEADERREAARRAEADARAAKEAQAAEHAYATREHARLQRWKDMAPERDPAAVRAAWDAMDEDTELARELFWTDRYVRYRDTGGGGCNSADRRASGRRQRTTRTARRSVPRSRVRTRRRTTFWRGSRRPRGACVRRPRAARRPR